MLLVNFSKYDNIVQKAAAKGTGGSGSVSATLQASYISRVYTKVMHEDYQYVPLVCMYDFVNDGTDPTYNEDNLGALNADYSQKSS